MGTKARLRKIARREAAKLGHDLGYFKRYGEGCFHVAYCIKCGSSVGFFTDEASADRMRNAPGFDRHVYGSGLIAKDLLPPRAKGCLAGSGIYCPCKAKDDKP